MAGSGRRRRGAAPPLHPPPRSGGRGRPSGPPARGRAPTRLAGRLLGIQAVLQDQAGQAAGVHGLAAIRQFGGQADEQLGKALRLQRRKLLLGLGAHAGIRGLRRLQQLRQLAGGSHPGGPWALPPLRSAPAFEQQASWAAADPRGNEAALISGVCGRWGASPLHPSPK